ncbi:uncharacterized protein EI90DRAFT_3131972 [Cantharellus anzutake]|uniref:uncharacterized protein n=1 Tax=Cantharellus anzutake TaxID=1750568 RepID=UPI0019054735|nr:uncharacterized protein EI90DRAFT_3131972 [Cantharellus anzutake]KAF8320613.1 hypothetical protein EI90DRAFT_3131972 [Cantharellus anzutake]
MPRRKPFSHKQKKAQLQEKRAVKRGDVDSDALIPSASGTARRRTAPSSRVLQPSDARKIESTRRLQSTFLKQSHEFRIRSKLLASTFALPRPIKDSACHVPNDIIDLPDDLGCPKRPKWRYDMSKKEVDSNEARSFEQWREHAAKRMNEWQGRGEESNETLDPLGDLNSPSHYEENLEVWRQLWRVTEISSILLVLLDTRCPPLHIPPSLHNFISSLQPPKQVIFILTKIGIVGEECASAWRSWLEQRFPAYQVILTESYRQMEGEEERKGQGSRKQYTPHIAAVALESLVVALKRAHGNLLIPPAHVLASPDKIARWRPRVRESVDWDAVIRSHESKISSHGDAHEPLGSVDAESDGGHEENAGDDEPENDIVLLPDLPGQPNVGKSSLLNALFGAKKVKASRTPGKVTSEHVEKFMKLTLALNQTKHFQTLFWTPEIRLVDCPGLVLPNYVPMELQALCSILPISQILTIPSCIRYIGSIMPLEEVFRLQNFHPSHVAKEPVQDKRTWRTPRQRPAVLPTKSPLKWTAIDVMTAFAIKKGMVTAKAGRPDVNRAGNAILRAIAENKVRWAFWPPGYIQSRTKTKGIWIADDHPSMESLDDSDEAENDYSDIDLPQKRHHHDPEAASDTDELDSDDVEGPISRFSILDIEDVCTGDDGSEGGSDVASDEA